MQQQKTFPCLSRNHPEERSQSWTLGSNAILQTNSEVLAVLCTLKKHSKEAVPQCQLPLKQQEALQAAGWLPGGTCLEVPCFGRQALMSRVLWAPKGFLQCPSQHFHHRTGSFEICYHTQCFALSKPTSERAIFTQTHSNNQAREIEQEATVLTSCSLFYQCMKTAFLR